MSMHPRHAMDHPLPRNVTAFASARSKLAAQVERRTLDLLAEHLGAPRAATQEVRSDTRHDGDG